MNNLLAALIALGIVALALPPARAADDCVLVKDGQPQAAIVLPSDASDIEKLAAQELQTYVEKMSGARLPIGGEAVTKVFIGWEKGWPVVPPPGPPIGPQGFLLQVTPRYVWIRGAKRDDLLNGVYALLRDLGCRWFMPGEIGEVVPKSRDIVVPLTGRQEQPGFEFRQIWYAWGASPEGAQRLGDWLRRNRCGGIRVAHGHNLVETLPPAQYLKDHPEYYSLVNGERKPYQLCTTNPDVIRLVIERVNKYFDDNPTADSYSLCPDDNTSFCECPNCTALDVIKSDPTYPDRPTVTDRYLHFMNQVARGIQAKHPGKLVTTYAYVNYSTPPVRESIDPHVIVVFTTSVFCSIHGVGDGFCESRRKMKDILAGWVRKASHVYIYEYDPDPGNAELPCPLYGARMREMPVYHKMGVRGFSFETHDSWATLFPNFYVSARMMWDPDQDPKALLDDICEKFFAESAAPMRRYYGTLERAFSDHPKNEGWGHAYYPDAYTPEIVAACADAIAEGQRLAREPITRRRVEIIARGFAYLQTYLDLRRRQTGLGSREEFSAGYEQLANQAKSLNAENEDFMLARVALKEDLEPWFASAVAASARDFNFVQDWRLIGPFDNALNRGFARAYPPEREINLNAAYDGKAGKVRWTTYHAPDWRGYVDLKRLFEPNEWVCAYALCWVTAPRETQAQLRVGSNDAVAVWLGGREVWRNDAARLAKIDDDIVPVTLPAGTTPILLKIGQHQREWGFFFRITDAAGNPLPSLRFSTALAPTPPARP